MKFPKLTISLFLTLIRLLFAPWFMPIVCVWLLPNSQVATRILVCFIFLSFCFTDFLDGYLARKFNQSSDLGKLLDPLADKMLLFSTIVALVSLQKIYFFWAIIFIGRELYIMGLREIALFYQFSVDVLYVGKAKTVFQCLYISSVLLCITGAHYLEQALLAVALFLTIYSAYIYTKVFINKWKQA